MDKSKYDVFIGKILDGRYKILELVGVGGMAFVLKATDLVMNRTVAIKILNEDLNGDEQAEQRFINESKAVAMLSHKNIVNIYDVAIYADMKYIVMEFLDGITLKEYLTRKEKLDWKEAAFYICQILRALDHAHTKGIVHRDIKPQNIILLRTGEIKVTDFGIAKIPNTEPLTMTDKALGTVYYISPEQASGRPTGFYSDLYSVGVMFYETVTGVLPFVATSPVTVAMMQVSDVPKSPSEHVPELPSAIVSVILKAMEKLPENRFKSAHSMARVIEEIVINPDYEFKVDEEFEDYNNTGTLAINQVQPDANEFQSQADKEYAEAQRKIAQKLADTDVNVKKKKRNKKETGAFSGGGLLPIAAALTFAFILALVGLGIAVGYQVVTRIFSNEKKIVTVEIPDLINKTWDETLEKELLAKKIRVRTQYDNSDHEDRNIILRQNPVGGVKRNLTPNMDFIEVYVNLSQGKKDIIVPDMTIIEYREAKTKLELLGLRVIEYEQFNPTVLSGYVISTTPSAGSKLKIGDTINVYKSKGQEVRQISVPSIDGKTEEEAVQLLREYRLVPGKVDIIKTDDESKDGKVTGQSITTGSMVNEYSTVINFSVFKYEKPDQPNESSEVSEIIIEP